MNTDDNGFIPPVVIAVIIAVVVALVCLWLWPWYTIGALIISGGIASLIYLGNPKMSAGIIIAGSVLIALGYFGVI